MGVEEAVVIVVGGRGNNILNTRYSERSSVKIYFCFFPPAKVEIEIRINI